MVDFAKDETVWYTHYVEAWNHATNNGFDLKTLMADGEKEMGKKATADFCRSFRHSSPYTEYFQKNQ